MKEALQFYINGEWVDPQEPKTHDVINPATEEVIGKISLGSSADLDAAVAAAKAAFPAFSQTSKEERLALLGKIAEGYKARIGEIAETISAEMGAPAWLAKAAQAPSGLAHFGQAMAVLAEYEFEEDRGGTLIAKEPVGVCGFITPWNWPINQIACKVAPAIAAGCTMVLKPSEVAPLNANSLGRDSPRCRRPQGRLQPGQWRRPLGWRSDFLPSRHRHGLLHRLHPRWSRGR